MQPELYPLFENRIQLFFPRLKEMIFAETIPLKAVFCKSKNPIPYAKRLEGHFLPIEEGQPWGDPWDSAWFHLTGTVPAAWNGKKPALRLDLGGEALLFDEKGVPYFGMARNSVFNATYSKTLKQFEKPARAGQKIDLWIEAAANDLFGLTMDCDPAENCPQPRGTYDARAYQMRIGVFREQVMQLRYDVDVIRSLLKTIPKDDYRYGRILRISADAIDAFSENPDNAEKARKILENILKMPAMKVTAVGHAHIDVGRLWPVRETIRKSARTFASQIYNIEHEKDYVFGASQPQNYAFVKEHYPELFRKIKEKVAEGRWELQGGMWVEADCDIISGESMVRQFIHGKNFFMDEFGVEVKNLWLPDVFGYSAAMPPELPREADRLPLPVIYIDRWSKSTKSEVVTTDNAAAAVGLAKRCREAGAKQFLLQFHSDNVVAETRLHAVETYLKKNRIPYLTEGAPDPADGAAAVLGNAPEFHRLKELPANTYYGGFFDSWDYPTADLFKQVFICRQDFKSMAAKVDELLQSGKKTGKRIHLIPASGFFDRKREDD